MNAISSGPIRTIAASAFPDSTASSTMLRPMRRCEETSVRMTSQAPRSGSPAPRRRCTGQCIYVDAGYSITMVPESIMN